MFFSVKIYVLRVKNLDELRNKILKKQTINTKIIFKNLRITKEHKTLGSEKKCI